MGETIYRLRLADQTTWVVVAADDDAARRKAELYFPNERVIVESSTDSSPWKTIDPCCRRCPASDVMQDLGHACEVSCGGTD